MTHKSLGPFARSVTGRGDRVALHLRQASRFSGDPWAASTAAFLAATCSALIRPFFER